MSLHGVHAKVLVDGTDYRLHRWAEPHLRRVGRRSLDESQHARKWNSVSGRKFLLSWAADWFNQRAIIHRRQWIGQKISLICCVTGQKTRISQMVVWTTPASRRVVILPRRLAFLVRFHKLSDVGRHISSHATEYRFSHSLTKVSIRHHQQQPSASSSV